MAISMLGRLIFNMGIAIPDKTVILIETAPWWSSLEVLFYHAGYKSGHTQLTLKSGVQGFDYMRTR